jgi:hypothetical protein
VPFFPSDVAPLCPSIIAFLRRFFAPSHSVFSVFFAFVRCAALQRGNTPLHCAARRGVVRTAALLVARGARKSARRADDGARPADVAAHDPMREALRYAVQSPPPAVAAAAEERRRSDDADAQVAAFALLRTTAAAGAAAIRAARTPRPTPLPTPPAAQASGHVAVTVPAEDVLALCAARVERVSISAAASDSAASEAPRPAEHWLLRIPDAPPPPFGGAPRAASASSASSAVTSTVTSTVPSASSSASSVPSGLSVGGVAREDEAAAVLAAVVDAVAARRRDVH